jgi:serine/threonine-protein kinase
VVNAVMTDGRLAAALVDRYHIERALGQGGMATVYLAEDLKHDRNVALKVLKPELAVVLGAERERLRAKLDRETRHEPYVVPSFTGAPMDPVVRLALQRSLGPGSNRSLTRRRLLRQHAHEPVGES